VSTDPLTPVWARLDGPHPIFLQPEAADFPPGGWTYVAALGVLRELRPAGFTTCAGCGDVARVVSLATAGGEVKLRAACRACGQSVIREEGFDPILAGQARETGHERGQRARIREALRQREIHALPLRG